ncbi:Pseudouridine kinase [Lentibacillus sp. JNUCC-1]|uniref:carbohydrate kinase n=1 Tax=Lentibacillus sp. JNUCC-1 TaxID=2654513 RepID=UPI0012E858A5|nr:carbohydrate kinase [Lentibacillus sp. JNUCC-1]MUV37903.1 Pseudouridine kinase [Lentibacillus sp. JNUCC-1]
MTDNKWHAMSPNEQQIYDLIKNDPYISQQVLADKLNRSRPAVANLISGMIKKGYIKGKAYVLNEPRQIVCIGGANVDRKFYGKGPLQQGTSNPVRSTQNAGGVARNIAENLGRLGQDVSLLTAAGRDADWTAIAQDSAPYMNLEHVAYMPGVNTGTYTAVLDETGEMAIAFADMDVYDTLTPEWLESQKSLITHAGCIIADLNCPKETLEALIHMAKQQGIPLILIGVSAPKMARLPADLTGVTWLITNRDESEAFFNEIIENDQDWERIVEKWISTGLEHIVVTRGEKGAMLGSQTDPVQHVPAMDPETIADVTGSGDAFSAALIYGWLKGFPLKKIGQAGIMNATKTLQSPHTVRPDLTETQLQTDMEAF